MKVTRRHANACPHILKTQFLLHPCTQNKESKYSWILHSYIVNSLVSSNEFNTLLKIPCFKISLLCTNDVHHTQVRCQEYMPFTYQLLHVFLLETFLDVQNLTLLYFTIFGTESCSRIQTHHRLPMKETQ